MTETTNETTHDPTNPDIQEALSIRYGNSGLYIVPLRSNRFALFDRSFTLYEIVDELPDPQTIRNLSIEFQQNLHRKSDRKSDRNTPRAFELEI